MFFLCCMLYLLGRSGAPNQFPMFVVILCQVEALRSAPEVQEFLFSDPFAVGALKFCGVVRSTFFLECWLTQGVAPCSPGAMARCAIAADAFRN